MYDSNLRHLLASGFLVVWLAAPPVAGAQDKKEENASKFHALLLSAAESYKGYGRVDDILRFAPTLCSSPPPGPPRLSASQDPGTHGQKLYFLYAWDAASYLRSSIEDSYKDPKCVPIYEKKAAEQALVKESWSCVKVGKEEARAAGKLKNSDEYSRTIERNGERFTTGERKDLFIMVKLDEQVEGTDRGWVYGTVAPDGTTVTSSGCVKSCMACHETAGQGRLFGLPTHPAAKPEMPMENYSVIHFSNLAVLGIAIAAALLLVLVFLTYRGPS